MAVPPANQMEVVPCPLPTPPADKDLTHVLTKDEPFYLNEPGADPSRVARSRKDRKFWW